MSLPLNSELSKKLQVRFLPVKKACYKNAIKALTPGYLYAEGNVTLLVNGHIPLTTAHAFIIYENEIIEPTITDLDSIQSYEIKAEYMFGQVHEFLKEGVEMPFNVFSKLI